MEIDFPCSGAFYGAIRTYVRPPHVAHVRPPYVRPPNTAKEGATLVEIALLERFLANLSGGQKLEEFVDLHDKFLEENLE